MPLVQSKARVAWYVGCPSKVADEKEEKMKDIPMELKWFGVCLALLPSVREKLRPSLSGIADRP